MVNETGSGKPGYGRERLNSPGRFGPDPRISIRARGELYAAPRGSVEKPRFEAGVLASHAAWEIKPNRRVRPRGTRRRRLRAAQALHRANIRAATAAASRLRFTAVAVR